MRNAHGNRLQIFVKVMARQEIGRNNTKIGMLSGWRLKSLLSDFLFEGLSGIGQTSATVSSTWLC